MDDLWKKLESVEAKLNRMNKLLESMSKLVGPFGVNMGDGTILTQTLHGIKYLVHSDDLVSTPNMIVYRQWEADVSHFLYSNLTPDNVFVDVGANFGYFTCLAGSIIGNRESGRVYAFEPNPALANLIRKNIAINWSMCPIELIEAAAADENGQATLYCPQGCSPNASLFRPPSDDRVETVKVDKVRIDDRLPGDVRVDLLKLDVEGAEFSVLKGARETLLRNPDVKVIMEWSLRQIKQAGVKPEALLSLINELGFGAFEVHPDMEPVTFDKMLSINYANICLARN